MARKLRILVIEDDAAIAMAVRDRLESEGYEVGFAGEGHEGLRLAADGWDAIVLDLMLPGLDGLSICRELRSRGSTTPILVLTAKDQVVDKVVGLRIGADDYLAKPFEMIELLARLEALLRRTVRPQAGAKAYPIGDFVLDLRNQELRREGVSVPLSTQEYKLLKYLYEHQGEVLDRDELLSAVWGYDESTYTRTVDVHIAALRQKLGDRHRQSLILTVRGRGYKLVRE